MGLPVSGIGGISGWQEAAEFLLLGAVTVQVCTAVMHYGYRIIEDMLDGLSNWMDEKGFRTLDDFRGASLGRVVEWKRLDLNYKIVARINPQTCIGCDLCYIACWDGAHQCIHLDGGAQPEAIESSTRRRLTSSPSPSLSRPGDGSTPPERIPRVDEAECVGCNLCWLVCPVEGCITMEPVETGLPPQTWEQRCRDR